MENIDNSKIIVAHIESGGTHIKRGVLTNEKKVKAMKKEIETFNSSKSVSNHIEASGTHTEAINVAMHYGFKKEGLNHIELLCNSQVKKFSKSHTQILYADTQWVKIVTLYDKGGLETIQSNIYNK